MASVASGTDNRPVVNCVGQIDRVKIRDCPGQLEAMYSTCTYIVLSFDP